MSAQFNNDLRSEAKTYQRDKNHTTKWARGSAPAPGKKCDNNFPLFRNNCECGARPLARDWNRRCGRHYNNHATNEKQQNQKYAVARKAFRNEVVEATDGPVSGVSDSSGDEEYHCPSTSTVTDVDIMYSYDAEAGPVHGEDVLSYAVTQAVQRFENKETEKLVKTEYELIADIRDDLDYAADEDDFEVINHEHAL